jgi:hypothetical protein
LQRTTISRLWNKLTMNNRERPATARARTSRREFAKTVTAAIVCAPLVAATTGAQEARPPATKQSPAPPNPRATPAAATTAQTPSTPSPLAEAYAEVARLRFGGKLTAAEDLARMKRDVEGNVRTAERLRAFKLKNAYEPDFIFIA